MESIIYGLAGMSVGLVGLVVYVVKNKKNDSGEVEELKKKIGDLEGSAHALTTENNEKKYFLHFTNRISYFVFLYGRFRRVEY